MFARVVPVLRTPFGVDFFDYKIPSSLDIRVGQIVWVPFRQRPTPALVMEILTNSPVAQKALPISGLYGDLRFPSLLLHLLQWMAQQTFSSQPTVLKSWVRHLPKRPFIGGLIPPIIEYKNDSLSIHEQWVNHPQEIILKKCLKNLTQHKRRLILTPWKNRIQFYTKNIPQSHILHGDLNPGDAFRAWHHFLTAPKGSTLIATRVGAWLAPLADHVILDEPENDDHKQDELAPRYDVRKILEWCAQHTNIKIESYGLTPPLSSSHSAPLIDLPLRIHIRHPHGRSSIPMIQSDTLHELRTHEGPRVIIHPIRGIAARFTCRDCGWQARCERCQSPFAAEADHARCRMCGLIATLPSTCALCGGTDLGKALPGIERLKNAWAKHEPAMAIQWRNRSNEFIDDPFPQGALVVITNAELLTGGEDVRRREHQCVAFRRVADRVAEAHGKLIVQSSADTAHLWPSWLTTEGIHQWHSREIHERKLFRYPPAVHLVKAIVTSDEPRAKQWMERARDATRTLAIEWRGPFPVAFRSRSRSTRWICHLIFPPNILEEKLVQTLAPLADSALIDLDPIAFFR